jgi:hypothetical protein
MAEVDVKIFDLCRPGPGDCCFNTAADRPAELFSLTEKFDEPKTKPRALGPRFSVRKIFCADQK